MSLIDISNLPEKLSFILALTPFLAVIITLGVLLKKSYEVVSMYSSFWLIVSVILSFFYLYRLLKGETVDFLITSAILSNVLVVYRQLRLKGK